MYVGFDAKEIRRKKNNDKSYVSPIGCGIKIENIDEFKKAYFDIMEEKFAKINKEFRRKIYSNFYLKKFLGLTESLKLVEEFYNDIREYIMGVEIYVTQIKISKIPIIYMYRENGIIAAEESKEFLKTLQSAYSYISAWKYYEENKTDEDILLIDHFQGSITAAWQSLQKRLLDVYFKGDLCNPLISASDLLLGLIDDLLLKKCKTISQKEIKDILRQLKIDGETKFIRIDFIVPLKRDPITLDKKKHLHHPIYFLVKDKKPKDMDYREHLQQLEFSPVFDKLVNKACENDAAIKIYNELMDFLIFDRGDKIFYFEERGEGIAKSLHKQYNIPIEEIKI